MEKELFLNSIVTIINKNGKITNFKKNFGTRHLEVMARYVEENYPDIKTSYSDVAMYETICREDNVIFLNFGKEKKDGVDKYDYLMLVPETLSKKQKSILQNFKDINKSSINSLSIYSFDKKNNKLKDLHYKEKLKYNIDELENLMNLKEDLQEIIIDTFYNDIVPSIINGRTTVDGVSYHISYNVVISGHVVKEINSEIPTLMINNYDEFNNYLVMYVTKQLEFLKNNIFISPTSFLLEDEKNENIRYCLMNLFINATSYDFNNPIEYLKMRISFLDNECLYDKFDSYKKVVDLSDIDCHIESCVFQQHPANETPYAFFSRIVKNDDEDSYLLPKIRYGIKDDNGEKTVCIYGIQGNKKKNVFTNFEKKINRYLFKINKGIEKDQDYLDYQNEKDLGIASFYPENIIDITPNAVLALTIFLKTIKELGINKCKVIDFLPTRYYGNLNGRIAAVNLLKGIYREEELTKKIANVELKMDDIQHNITNKLIRTVNRVNYHLGNMSNISYPYEIDDSMYFILNDNIKDDYNLINKVYNEINLDINQIRR